MVNRAVNLTALSVFVALTLISAPEPAFAGGFEYGTDNGALALARGGASTARPSLSALYTNLAGMADTERVDVFLSTNLVFRQLAFQRIGFEIVEDETPLFPGPMIAVHIRLSDHLVLGIGANGPAAVGEGHFPRGSSGEPGPSRYLMTDMSLIYGIPTVALAFTVPDAEWLRFGFGFQPAIAYAELSVYANVLAPDEELFDVRADAEVWDYFLPAVQIGFLARVGQRVEIGGQVRLTDSVSAEGEVWPTAFPFEPELRETYEPSRGRVEVPLPFATVRLGLRYRHPRPGFEERSGRYAPPHRSELFDVELDLVYESNSDFDEFVVYPLDPVHLPPPMGEIVIPELPVKQNWRDTINLRFGGTVNLIGGDLSLSTGVFYQSGAAPLAYTHLFAPAWTTIGLSFGVTYRVRWFEVTLSYAHLFLPERDVSLEQGGIFALRASPEGGTYDSPAINAGHYEASFDILSISLAARVGAR